MERDNEKRDLEEFSGDMIFDFGCLIYQFRQGQQEEGGPDGSGDRGKTTQGRATEE